MTSASQPCPIHRQRRRTQRNGEDHARSTPHVDDRPGPSPGGSQRMTRDILPTIRSAPGFVAGYWLELSTAAASRSSCSRPRSRRGDRPRRPATGQPPASASPRWTSGEWLQRLSPHGSAMHPGDASAASGRRRSRGLAHESRDRYLRRLRSGPQRIVWALNARWPPRLYRARGSEKARACRAFG